MRGRVQTLGPHMNVVRLGSTSGHGGSLPGTSRTAWIWTVTATAGMAGLNVLTYLTAYLDACGRNRRKPVSASRVGRRRSPNRSQTRAAILS